jgi:hypothetical protein
VAKQRAGGEISLITTEFAVVAKLVQNPVCGLAENYQPQATA